MGIFTTLQIAMRFTTFQFSQKRRMYQGEIEDNCENIHSHEQM